MKRLNVVQSLQKGIYNNNQNFFDNRLNRHIVCGVFFIKILKSEDT